MFSAIKKIVFPALLFLSVPVYVYGITFNASVDKNKIALNEYAVYSLTVSGEEANFPEPKMEELADFNRYGAGKSQNISFVNGKRSGKVTYSYTLSPKKTGKFTIPPAKIEYEQKTYLTEPIEVEVTEAAKIQSAQVQTQRQASSKQPAGKIIGNVFVKAAADKKEVYVNEKLIYKFSFYTNVDLVSNPTYYPPDFKGFWNDSSNPSNRYENIDGVNYMVNEIDTVLYPIETGKLIINPGALRITVMDFSSPGNDFFDLLLNMGQRQEKMLESDPVTVKVLPLPKENIPADFKGAVGDFKISASLDKTDVNTGEPVTLTVKITGKGNMKSVNDIVFNPGKDFKVYDTVSSNVTENSREFQIVMVPLAPGEKTVPPVKLSFFSPSKKIYSFVETLPLKIKAEGAAVINTANNYAAASQDISGVKSDINYNKQIKRIKSYYKGYLVKNKFFRLAFVPFILFFVCALSFKFYRGRKRGDPSFAFKENAYELSKKCIADAEGKINGGKCHDFYENVYEGLIAAVTAKTGAHSDGLTAAEIMENLKKSGLSDNEVKNIGEVLNLINFYRFASVKSDEKGMRELIGKVKDMLLALRK